jgi:hypothetical protein
MRWIGWFYSAASSSVYFRGVQPRGAYFGQHRLNIQPYGGGQQ